MPSASAGAAGDFAIEVDASLLGWDSRIFMRTLPLLVCSPVTQSKTGFIHFLHSDMTRHDTPHHHILDIISHILT